MEKLLMLGTSLSSVEIIKYAKSQGMYTIVTDDRTPDYSIAKQYSDEYWMISTGEIDVLEEKCRKEGITTVMCGVSEFNLEMTMELCKRLGLQCYCTPDAWHFSRDKADFKALCRGVGAPIADDYFLTDALTEEELSTVKYPVVVKPVDLSGNRGISYCENREELIKAYHYARSKSNNPKIVVERMLHGKEWYTYYAIAEGEIHQICINAMEAEPGQLKNLYSLTTSITDNVKRINEEINPAIERVLKKVGCREGIAWVQFMLDEDDHFYIIEMGYRLPGDLPDYAYPSLIGFDAIKWITDYARGVKHTPADLPPAQTEAFKNCSCGYSLWTHKSGTIKSFMGIEKAVQLPGVSFHSQFVVGDEFHVHSPVGVFSIYAESIDDFCKKIDLINHLIRIEDETGEDIIIRYTDFDYLKCTYRKGLNE